MTIDSQNAQLSNAKPHCVRRVKDNSFHLRAAKSVAQFLLGVF